MIKKDIKVLFDALCVEMRDAGHTKSRTDTQQKHLRDLFREIDLLFTRPTEYQYNDEICRKILDKANQVPELKYTKEKGFF